MEHVNHHLNSHCYAYTSYELVHMTGSVLDPAPTSSSDLSILHLSSNIVHILKFRQYVGSPCFLRSSVLQVWPGPPFHPLSELQYPSHHLTLFTSFPLRWCSYSPVKVQFIHLHQ